MNNIIIATFVLIATQVVIQGQIILPGQCVNHQVVQNFNIERYLGKWYEIEKFPTIFEYGGICNKAEYGLLENGNISVRNSMVIESTGAPDEIIGTARIDSNDGSAKLLVNFPVSGNREAPYWVLDTDYDGYAIVWGCTNVGATNSFHFTWFLSRTKTVTTEMRNKIHTTMESFQIPIDRLVVTEQEAEVCPPERK